MLLCVDRSTRAGLYLFLLWFVVILSSNELVCLYKCYICMCEITRMQMIFLYIYLFFITFHSNIDIWTRTYLANLFPFKHYLNKGKGKYSDVFSAISDSLSHENQWATAFRPSLAVSLTLWKTPPTKSPALSTSCSTLSKILPKLSHPKLNLRSSADVLIANKVTPMNSIQNSSIILTRSVLHLSICKSFISKDFKNVLFRMHLFIVLIAPW